MVEGASAVDMMAAAMAINEEAESVLRQHRRKGIPLKALPGLNEHKSSQNIPSNVQQAPVVSTQAAKPATDADADAAIEEEKTSSVVSKTAAGNRSRKQNCPHRSLLPF